MGWSDISLEQYIELQSVSDDPFEIISIILDMDSADLDAMPYEDFLVLLPTVEFIKTPPPRPSTTEINIEGVRFDIIDFKRLEIGAYIDIEHYLFEKDTIGENLHIILAILYRTFTEGVLGNIKYSEYDSSLNTPLSQHLLTVKMDKIFHILGDYFRWRENIKDTYKGLFNSDDEKLSEEEEKAMLADMTTRERLEYEGGQKVGKWGWVVMLYKLADRNPLKIDKAAKLSVIAAFNLLSMMQELKINEQPPQ